MASSVATMPTDDWRDPNRHAAGVFAAHAHQPFGKPPRKVLVRDRDRDRDRVAVTSSPSSSSTPMAIGGTDAVSLRKTETSSDGGEDAGSLATRERQSRILNRWAARQAREMITTIERQAHEAEISALTATTQPVSARAASFLRDSSPALSDTSTASAPAADGCGAASANASACSSIDLSPRVRASSLILMWRELEAEACSIAPSNRTTSAGGNSGFAAAVVEEYSGGSDVFDDSEAYGDWDSDNTMTTAHSSMNESEQGRVGSIVKMLSSANATGRSTATSWSEEVEPLSRESSGVSYNGESRSLHTAQYSSGVGLRCVRGRREMEDLLAKLEKERRRELAAMAERQPVSHFLYRGRLQSMLRLRALRQEVAAEDQQRAASTTLELDRLQTGSTISFLRQGFSNREQHDCSGVPLLENSSHVDIQFPIDTNGSNNFNSADQCAGDSNQYQVVVSPRDSESSPAELNSPHSRSDDLQERSHSLDDSWDDRSLWVSNLEWQRPLDSSPSHDSQGDIITEEVESSTQNISSNPVWITGSPNSWRGWGVSRQEAYHDLVQKFSDNEELRDLLERRRVSTSLASDFCDKMNRLILSFLQRQRQQSFDDNFAEDYEEQAFWGCNDEFQNADQVASASSSLIPIPYQTLNHQEIQDSWQHTSFRHYSSQNFLETEPMHDLRSDIAKIHHEISELRKLVETCMEWQAKLQHSIKQEVSDAVRQSVGLGSATIFSRPKTGRKGSCCVCYEMQVDSLLYRCGHMCTCVKCAHELQWSSGKCPICRSPIVDVVRAYPNS